MAEITWIKLKTDMFDDEKIKLIERMPDGDGVLIIWVKLLAYAGKVNCGGYIMISDNIPMNIEEMAIIFNRPLEKVRYAIQVLQRYKMIEVDENETVCISNWEKHQNIEGLEKVRLQSAERNRKYRERKKQKALQAPNEKRDVSVTSCDGTDKEKEKELDKDIDKEVELQQESSAPPPSVVVVDDSQSNVNPFTFYQQNGFGLTMNSITQQKIMSWCDDLSDELVIYAMQKAIESNRISWSYAEGILKNWASKRVKTIQDVDALEAQFAAQNQAKQQRSYGRQQKVEPVPDWYQQQKLERQGQAQQPTEPTQINDFEAERQALLARIK